jgi:hypothetical protein
VVSIIVHGSSDADPNDFDNLAQGDQVVTNSPYVFGTPNGETIAGGGDQYQIVYAGAGNDTVNGTGKDDVLYSGSGDDTIKGNDGNDAIYGGSGNDTVNANNGNDTIIGGFGADRLTGSNGDDVFVYLSIADSNSNQFDTITDFSSGSDKINLAVFGALAFLHLTSTSTPVPPHTIAWIYNSASNETILYVNPTDVALNIGSSALLEIHLQGVVSVNESDFIYQAATNAIIAASEAIDLELQSMGADEIILATVSAEMSSETSTSSTDAMSADATGGWTLQSEDETFKFVFDGDLEPIGSIRLARFGETSAYTTVNSDGAATIALASGSAIELWPEYTATPAEDHFTFHQEPIHAIAPGDPAVTFPAITIDPVGFTGTNAIATWQLAELGVTSGNGASPHQSQHEPPTSPQQTNNPHSVPNAAADLAELRGTPSNGASPHQSQHEPHTAPQQTNNPHSVPNAAADLAELGGTPGNGASLHQSQHEPHTGPQQTNNPHSVANAAADLAEPWATPGSGASHHQSQHEPHTASQQTGANNPHSPSTTPAAVGPSNQPAPASAAHTQIADEPGYGNSFHFKNTTFHYTEPVEFEVGLVPASVAQGHGAGAGGPKAILEIGTTALSPAEEYASSHTHLLQPQVASHGQHELMV